MTASEVIMALSRVGIITMDTDSYKVFKLTESAFISFNKGIGRLMIDTGEYPAYMLFIDDLSRIDDFWIDDIRILTIHRELPRCVYRIYLNYASDKSTIERIEYHE